METFTEFLLWFCLVLIAYTYAGYFPLVWMISKLWREHRMINDTGNEVPNVAVIISAFNEEKVIEARIQNLLALAYPRDKIEFLIGSDGSQDRTAEICQRYADRIKFTDFKVNRGKASVLNDLVASTEAEILVFSDANTDFRADAITHLVAPFTDDRVGAVSGALVLEDEGHDSELDSRYWNFESQMKVAESRIGGLLGSNGAIYAVRADQYEPIPADSLVDDFLIVMNVSVRGSVVCYEQAAKATEPVGGGMSDEYKRRVRIGFGNYQIFFRNLHFLYEGGLVLAFTYVSHKVLRWFVPHLYLVGWLLHIPLLDQTFYQVTFTLMGLGVLIPLILWKSGVGEKLPGPIRLGVYLTVLNLAFFKGFLNFLRGGTTGTWTPTSR